MGTRSQLSCILNTISLGAFYFEVAMILRESSYLNAILFCCESWYYLSKKQLEVFEYADAKFFQICFRSSDKTTREAYYLETGKLRIKHVIVKRRMMMLSKFLKEKRVESDLLRKTYFAQSLSPTKFNCFFTISQNREEYNITLTDDEIKVMSKSKFKKYIEDKIYQYSLNELFQGKKSKVQNINNNTFHVMINTLTLYWVICLELNGKNNLLQCNKKYFRISQIH